MICHTPRCMALYWQIGGCERAGCGGWVMDGGEGFLGPVCGCGVPGALRGAQVSEGGEGVGTGRGQDRLQAQLPEAWPLGLWKGPLPWLRVCTVSHISAPCKSPGAPNPSPASPTGRRLVLGCSCLWRGSPGSPPGASFLEEEIIEDNRDPHRPSLKLRKESLDPGVVGPPPAPAAEGRAILTPTLHGAR